jgi:hypothetical protein
MNAISYINGDAQITDFPVCSARPLAVLVQSCNDLLAGPNRYLSSGNSLLALDLGWQTAGTADVVDTVLHAWVAELLTNPAWGVARYAKLSAIKAISDIAALHRNAASGDMPTSATWTAAHRAARAAERTSTPVLNPAGNHAIRAAYESTAPIDAYGQTTLNTVTGNAVRAHALAAGVNTAARVVEVTRQAIRAWRELADLHQTGTSQHRSTMALQRIAAPACGAPSRGFAGRLRAAAEGTEPARSTQDSYVT